jgi:hypothetical protein
MRRSALTYSEGAKRGFVPHQVRVFVPPFGNKGRGINVRSFSYGMGRIGFRRIVAYQKAQRGYDIHLPKLHCGV